MKLPSRYNPSLSENKWYTFWLEKGYFSSKPDNREPYTIVIPPPNVTGVLHMGHMLNNTIQDILVRRERMKGKNALWVPGTDHASIATEAKVVEKLKNEGINKSDISREKFLEHAWEWKEKHGGIILEQLKKLGASCDWDRTCFTMDNARSESVIKVFIELYKKGKIYRGVRMVNWDPEAKTAVSDEEVNYTEEQSKLYYINYPVAGENSHLTIATTRPETILGDTAVCVNPKDERYFHLRGKKAIIPLVNRKVPIIEDDYVDMEFGTGCLKITPAHDVNDYEIGIRHNLEIIDIFNDDGTLNEKAIVCVGLDRFVARTKVEELLKKEGFLAKVEDYQNKVGRSERTDSVIEPKLSMQWFLKMKDLAKPALENVLNDTIKLYPVKFKNTYRHWMENVKDWCVSRQLWWGHRIPAYYIQDTNDFVVAENKEEALLLAKNKTGNQRLNENELNQDEDVLDTWFSSWLWPISVFDGIRYPENDDINYYYPTDTLVTAPEILFFWVARMIIAGYEFRNEKPFKNVYLTGIVRDKLRRKMSKSLGNSPDPLELIDKYGADGVRVGMLLCSPAGNDLLFDESLPEQGRNFTNKIWNAFRLIYGWKSDKNIEQPEEAKLAIQWFEHKLSQNIAEIEKLYEKYKLSETLMILYKLFWDEFSSWYLEIIKPLYLQAIDEKTLHKTIEFLESLLKLLHPFIPFITEEIWQLIEPRKDGQSIMIANIPESTRPDRKLLSEFEQVKEVISAVRKIKQKNNMKNKEKISLFVKQEDSIYTSKFAPVLKKLINLATLEIVKKEKEGAASFRIQKIEFFIPMEVSVNYEEELKKIEEELVYTKGFLETVMKKLNNQNFINNAPEKVVNIELKKQADAEEKIKLLEERISGLKQNS
ncbi:valine--tRNA ligase [Bacteroidota bacterium]